MTVKELGGDEFRITYEYFIIGDYEELEVVHRSETVPDDIDIVGNVELAGQEHSDIYNAESPVREYQYQSEVTDYVEFSISEVVTVSDSEINRHSNLTYVDFPSATVRVKRPSNSSWQPLSTDRSVEIAGAGDGYTTDRFALFGSFRRQTVSARTGTHHFFVQNANATDEIRVENHSQLLREHAEVAPTTRDPDTELYYFITDCNNDVEARGFAMGDDRVVMCADRVDDTDGFLRTYTHQYTHLTQRLEPTPRSSWIVDSQAGYYELLVSKYLTYNSNTSYVGVESVRDRFAAHPRYSRNITDAAPGTSERDVSPAVVADRGSQLAAVFDLYIRTHSDGEHTLATLMNRLGDERVVTNQDIKWTVESLTGTDADPLFDRYVYGTEPVPYPEEEYRYRLGGPDSDLDRDGLDQRAELRRMASPINPDTDGDNVSDGVELAHGLDPTVSDTDGDGTSDSEAVYGGATATPSAATAQTTEATTPNSGADPRQGTTTAARSPSPATTTSTGAAPFVLGLVLLLICCLLAGRRRGK